MNTNDIARVAGLVGEPARTRMLVALIDGRALTAGELARAAGISAQTASRHLALLGEGGLIVATASGRHRYHRLASRDVAAILEGIMQLASASASAGEPRRRSVLTGPRDARMRMARTCYDHLAGRLGVAVADHLAAVGAIEFDLDQARMKPGLAIELARMGLQVDLPADSPADSPAASLAISSTISPAVSSAVSPAGSLQPLTCRPCMDWSERRPHLAGPLATRLCAHLLEQGWLRRPKEGRGLEVSGEGGRRLGDWLGAVRWRTVVGTP